MMESVQRQDVRKVTISLREEGPLCSLWAHRLPQENEKDLVERKNREAGAVGGKDLFLGTISIGPGECMPNSYAAHTLLPCTHDIIFQLKLLSSTKFTSFSACCTMRATLALVAAAALLQCVSAHMSFVHKESQIACDFEAGGASQDFIPNWLSSPIVMGANFSQWWMHGQVNCQSRALGSFALPANGRTVEHVLL
jgi:hypothetical protein